MPGFNSPLTTEVRSRGIRRSVRRQVGIRHCSVGYSLGPNAHLEQISSIGLKRQFEETDPVAHTNPSGLRGLPTPEAVGSNPQRDTNQRRRASFPCVERRNLKVPLGPSWSRCHGAVKLRERARFHRLCRRASRHLELGVPPTVGVLESPNSAVQRSPCPPRRPARHGSPQRAGVTANAQRVHP